MFKHTVTMIAWATLSAAPVIVGAQAVTTPQAPVVAPQATSAPLATCDCPESDTRGDLRDLAAFAPLGLLGAVAAVGTKPAFFAGNTVTPPLNTARGDDPKGPETEITDPARNASAEPPLDTRRRDVPPGVTAEAIRGGIRPPNTATPMPSVFLIGTGLIAVGCVTLLRARG